MCNHSNTIGHAIRSKITALGMKQSYAMKVIAKECDCSTITVYGWINGGRPWRKYLPGISRAMKLRLSRLEEIWMSTAIAQKANEKPAVLTKPTVDVSETFVPNLDDLQVAVSLVKLGAERRDNVMNLVKVLELGRKLS